ncbi:MAG: heme biosynthesis HemY N-terminal domain-containing protein [Pseudomonadota bacterium]|nr:heme biosynthesis HemY N-terminal domain-containing protein [Pseudomonadota bacterium]
MRAALWLIGLFVAAVALALLAGRNEGTVTLFWPPHRVDVSANLVLLGLLALFALLHFVLRGLSAMLELPRQARRWRAQQRERATHALLLEALIQQQAGRYLRARKAAEAALAREQALFDAGDAPAHTRSLRALAHLAVAESGHALQDQALRDEHLAHALRMAQAPGAMPELGEGIRLRAARWALHERDAPAALAHLQALPVGAARRTAALRVRLKAQHLSGQHAQALDTARLLVKHGAFTPHAARSLLRQLASECMAQAHDLGQLQAAWAALDAAERADAELALRAAQRLLALGEPLAADHPWLAPLWAHLLTPPDGLGSARQADEPQRARIAAVLQAALAADAQRAAPQGMAPWLARIEEASQAQPGDATLHYLAGMACLHRGLWGKAQQQLTQAVRGLAAPELRRSAWRALAQLAGQRGDTQAAQHAWQQAADT